MNTEEPRVPLASEPKRASCIDTRNIGGASQRLSESGIADAASIEGKQQRSDEPANWAEYIDRIYIEELMRRLDH